MFPVRKVYGSSPSEWVPGDNTGEIKAARIETGHPTPCRWLRISVFSNKLSLTYESAFFRDHAASVISCTQDQFYPAMDLFALCNRNRLAWGFSSTAKITLDLLLARYYSMPLFISLHPPA